MKVISKSAPPGAYKIEPCPDHQGMARIALYENARKVTVEVHWEYDEYIVEAPYSDGLAADIENHYARWISEARAAEATGEKSNSRLVLK